MFTFSTRSIAGARCMYISSLYNQKLAMSSASKDPTSLDDEEPLKISKAMKSYITRANAHDEFMRQQLNEYQIGKRHLANMMGKDPEIFTQEDVDEAIRYLFPSGLFDPRARPMMKHPDEVFPSKKAAEFDIQGRPYHSMFYTSKPNYYTLLHDAAEKLNGLNKYQDKMVVPPPSTSFLSGSEWLSKNSIEDILIEKLNDAQYTTLINTLERCSQHPYSYKEKEFFMKYRRSLSASTELQEIPEPQRDESGRPFIVYDGRRKRSNAQVKVIAQGSGRMEINNQDILFFKNRQDKEQIIFPLKLTGQLGKVDVIATVSEGGSAAQAGAIRYALSMCLRSFVDSETVEKMRLAGLLSFDPRTKERKKPGQPGARKKYTWKKR